MDKGMQQNLQAMYGGGQEQSQAPFVDAIDGDVARLVMPDGRTQEVPVASLPQGVREGQYLGDEGFDPGMEAQKMEGRRNRMAADDQGGDITL